MSINLNNPVDLSTKADLVGGLVPVSQLPSYVDDVVEVANYAALPITGETSKIYVTIDDNKSYRWTGSVYVLVSSPVDDTAYDATSWDGVTTIAPSKNALRDKFESLGTGGFSEIRIQDYSGPAIIGILGQYDASRTGTLVEVTLISDTLPVGSNVIAELRKNSTTTGNVLSTTLQITTTEAATNGRYVGTPVTTFSSSAIADGDVFYLYLTSVGSPEALNVRAILRYT